MPRSLQDLLTQAGFEAPPATPVAPAPIPDEAEGFAPKVVVRFQKKGRGGKKVTIVTGVTAGHEAIMARLKRDLGCGGTIEEGDLVIQGEQVERVARWLESRGATNVVRSR